MNIITAGEIKSITSHMEPGMIAYLSKLRYIANKVVKHLNKSKIITIDKKFERVKQHTFGSYLSSTTIETTWLPAKSSKPL